MYRRPLPSQLLTDVSLPIFSEGRGASALRLVYSLPLACVAGVEKGRGREEGKKAGGLGMFPLLSSSMAGGWGGWLVCEQALYGRTELLRELARRLRGGEPWDRANHRYVPLGWKNEFEGRGVQESLRGRHGL